MTTTTHEIAKAMLSEPDRPLQKSCVTCVHRHGWNCTRTGWVCDIEMRYEGRCNQQGQLTLWEPKPKRAGFWQRLFGKD